jgi:hypothetical protein
MPNTMNLASCIQFLFPNASRNDYRVSSVGGEQQVTHWNVAALGAKPSNETLLAAWPEVLAKQESKRVANDLLAALKAAYANFSDGGKWAFGNAYDTVVNHIRRGDIAAAKLTVQMIAIPAEVPETSPEELATWTVKKTEILALFP